jgi:hypothetical protein
MYLPMNTTSEFQNQFQSMLKTAISDKARELAAGGTTGISIVNLSQIVMNDGLRYADGAPRDRSGYVREFESAVRAADLPIDIL